MSLKPGNETVGGWRLIHNVREQPSKSFAPVLVLEQIRWVSGPTAGRSRVGVKTMFVDKPIQKLERFRIDPDRKENILDRIKRLKYQLGWQSAAVHTSAGFPCNVGCATTGLTHSFKLWAKPISIGWPCDLCK